jgi:hypothetical protein
MRNWEENLVTACIVVMVLTALLMAWSVANERRNEELCKTDLAFAQKAENIKFCQPFVKAAAGEK